MTQVSAVSSPAVSNDRTDLFDFDLPKRLIADTPAVPRDSSRMLEVGTQLYDRAIGELPDRLRADDVVVINDTRVIPARLTGKRGAAKFEVTLHRQTGSHVWRAFARPARKLAQGDVVTFAPEFSAVVAVKLEAGEIELSFDPECDLRQKLRDHGAMPLPPYIKRADGASARDGDDYQTIYATHDGAVAAPTAGLHFTPDLFAALADRGIRVERVTLHVGAGTFLPVKADYVRDHRMHAEWGRIDRDTCNIINRARRDGGRVVAIGTTSLRLLESAADTDGTLNPFEDETTIFITPGYRFKIVDLLLTNFHLPRSTLFMLVSAFAGLDRMKAAYEHAKTLRYRFYSYGDATLLHRGDAS
ncbi:MAG: tRNA preQ1(34) S-adenosylmethionine ribosyltransferase-isomerase QueA [Pseudomonadota bacterium]|nr:tRNA preQ1(34) S-adenosylmethionine ribosyltransferase-isomerase QueA [Pseudomonadota bacterium]